MKDMNTFPPVRRLRFTDADGDKFTVTGTLRHVSIEWVGAGVSIVFRNEDAGSIAALILEARTNPHD